MDLATEHTEHSEFFSPVTTAGAGQNLFVLCGKENFSPLRLSESFELYRHGVVQFEDRDRHNHRPRFQISPLNSITIGAVYQYLFMKNDMKP